MFLDEQLKSLTERNKELEAAQEQNAAVQVQIQGKGGLGNSVTLLIE